MTNALAGYLCLKPEPPTPQGRGGEDSPTTVVTRKVTPAEGERGPEAPRAAQPGRKGGDRVAPFPDLGGAPQGGSDPRGREEKGQQNRN